MLTAEALEALAAGRLADPLAPVTVVVPSRVSALQLRRRLGAAGPFAAVRFETLPRVAELLAAGELARAGRRPLARPVGDYVAQQVALDSGGDLARVRDLAGYATSLRAIFRRLRRGGVRSAVDLPDALRTGRRAEILRLYDGFRRATTSFYDDEDLLDAAAVAVHERQAGAIEDLGAVYAVAPAGLSAGSRRLLDTLRTVAPTFEELDEDVSHAPARFVLAPDPAAEVREAVRAVLGLLESGSGLQDIAVFHGADGSYGDLLRDALATAAIPTFASGSPLAGTRAGRGVLGLAGLPAVDYSRTATLDVLGTGPVREFVEFAGESIRVDVPAWDRASRDAGVTRGLERWQHALEALVTQRAEEAASERYAENEQRRAALERERTMALRLSTFVRGLAELLEPLRASQPASDFIATFRRAVAAIFHPDAPAMDEVLDEVDQLGTIAAVGGAFSLETFHRALAANLESATLRERRFEDGVLVADYRQAAGLSFDHVIVCGAQEGVFPAGPGADVLLQDEDWRALRSAFPLIEDASLRIDRGFEAARRAIASARSTVTWTAPVWAAGGRREHYPSPLMVAAATRMDASLAAASDLRGAAPRPGWLDRVPSPLAGALRGVPLDAAELRLRETVAMRGSGGEPGPGHARWVSVALARGRSSKRFTEWDGNVAGIEDEGWLTLQTFVSPTSMESYAGCGFRYFCKSLLRLNTVEEPEEREVLSAADRGTLIHEALEHFFREQAEANRPAPGEPWTLADAARLDTLATEHLTVARTRGLTGLDVYAEHESRSIRADLRAFLEADTAFRLSTGAVPSAFEVAIPQTPIAGVTLRGVVDRIDRSPDGREAWVIDYKTGSDFGFRSIGDQQNPLVNGTKLQLPAYALAAADAEDVRAAYWFINRRSAYAFIPDPPAPVATEAFERTITAIVAGIREGAFPAVPGEEDEFYGSFDNCRYCDFDRICSRRRLELHRSKAEDPAMTPWHAVGRAARGEDEE